MESSYLCEGAISLEECARALKQMQHSKSPGPDGLPAECLFIGKAFVKFINCTGCTISSSNLDNLKDNVLDNIL